MILNDYITCEKNLSNLSLADRRGNNTRTSVRQFTTGRPVLCGVQSRKAAIPQHCLPPRGQDDALAGEEGSGLGDLKRLCSEQPA